SITQGAKLPSISSNTNRSCLRQAGWSTIRGRSGNAPRRRGTRPSRALAVQQALARRGLTAGDLVGLGITNQRETTLVWNPTTGEPYGNAIVWQDTRTDKIGTELVRGGRGEGSRQ